MFPETVLHTHRLILRPFTAPDIADTQASCDDALTQRWLPLPRPYTLEDAAAWCITVAHSLRESGDGIHFAITDTHTARLLGTVGLKKTDWRALVSEVGYWISPWARGRGIAAEATRALAQWLLTDRKFERLELRVAVANTASHKVALKAGFHREGILRSAGFTHSGRIDLVMYSLLPQDVPLTATAPVTATAPAPSSAPGPDTPPSPAPPSPPRTGSDPAGECLINGPVSLSVVTERREGR